MENGEAATSAEHEAKLATTFDPRTPLGQRLWTLRQKIANKGESLLDWDGVIREVQERRGELDDEIER